MDLLEACENGNEERVVELLLEAGPSKAPALLRQVDHGGRSALHVACLGGQLTVVRLLLGRTCQVFFPGRRREEVEDLIVPCGHNIRVIMKRKEDAHVPSALLQLPSDVVVQRHDLANGTTYLDNYGNAPIQCISCFGCGSEMKHVRDSIEIASELLRSGCQCNTSKTSNNWTPLHWSAFNGHHELTALMLNPQLCCTDQANALLPAIQFAVPLVQSEGLYPVDVAGRMGLQLRDEMEAWRQSVVRERACSYSVDGFEMGYREWRLHLDHVVVVQVFVQDFIANAQRPGEYAKQLAACLDTSTTVKASSRRNRLLPFSETDVLRYGQHLLYWCAGLNQVEAVVALLEIEFTTDDGATKRLDPLAHVEYDVAKSQSALHFACAMGHTAIVQTLLSRVVSHYTTTLTQSPSSLSAVPSKVHPMLGTFHQRRMSTKDIPFTALPGWLNHRLESPLYLAGLYNRAEVSTTLLSILPSSTIQAEIHLQNIEGSTLLETANDSVRTVLNLPTTSSFPTEYVLVFRRKHRLFRKTLQDVLEEESSRAPSLLAATVGSREQLRRYRESEWFDYVAVGATDTVLAQKAERMQLMVRRRGSTNMQVFHASAKHDFEPFRSLQRQLVVLNLIRDNVNLRRHLETQTIFDMFPLHDAVGHRAIAVHWVLGRGWLGQLQPWHALRQYLFESPTHTYDMLWPLRTYFGVKHALHIAWIQFYTSYLLVVSIPCVVVEGLWAFKTLPEAVPPLVMVVLIWITCLVERWKRKRAEMLCNWGFPVAADGGVNNLVRAEFHGDFVFDTTTNERDVQFPHAVHMLRIYLGAPLLLGMVAMAVLSFVGMKYLRAQQAASTVGVDDSDAFMPVISALNAVAIILLDKMYSKVAYALSHWENHRTVSDFESMLAIKLFTFKFLNAFMSLFWTAFVDREFDRLRYELFTILLFRQASSIVLSNLLPLVLVRHRWQQRGFRVDDLFQTMPPPLSTPTSPVTSADEDDVRVPAGIEMQQLMAAPYHVLDKQIDAMIRFGYVTMFLTVFPSAPFFVVLTNTLEMHLDVQCSLEAYRRPSFDGGTEIPVFQSILEFMSFAAVTVNCALLYLNMDVQAYLPTSSFAAETAASTTNLWMLLVVEHLVLGIKAAMALGIPDSPQWVNAHYAKLAKTQMIAPPPIVELHPADQRDVMDSGVHECSMDTTVDVALSTLQDGQTFALPPGDSSSKSLPTGNASTAPVSLSTAADALAVCNAPTLDKEALRQRELSTDTIQALQVELAAARTARDEALARIRNLEACMTKHGTCGFCDCGVPCEVKCIECKASMCRSCDAKQHDGVASGSHIRIDVSRVGHVVHGRLAQVEKLLHLPHNN
ncbi:hypothetical protein H310_01933 [Aphanomyces invadans]|uniref:Anoctamin transmembrane domain-containing protein n=1 Tax=Aphanomyces invadans TaxID=157072 RepID=A0A024UMP4_9STRA|nr:hypothetical protein H310_01933 [Aphanomyces invadans]ETW07410.1 hypothetical protein H310_01933 [Aphanomyces invadans]|eukprot:XP_008863503.1 hypothetical protein H310_01933 [Aphanomyces invadans]